MAFLEIWGPQGHDVVAIDGPRFSVGKSSDCDLSLASDAAVSRVHLMIEEMGGGWCLNDLGARNGTFVNGDRLFGMRMLHHGDEVTLGRSRLVFRDQNGSRDSSTETIADPPVLTARERDVLVELCRPLLLGDVFVEPATAHEIAQSLYVVDAAVKQHLARLYGKFGIGDEEGTSRRVRLANAAIQSGTVTTGDLQKRH
jgi:pSer/pThr/pTyr-binding forkhead associated (FHA) protein